MHVFYNALPRQLGALPGNSGRLRFALTHEGPAGLGLES